LQHDPVVYTIFLVFTGAWVLATLALYARQALLVSYIVLGMIMGPWGLGLVGDPEMVKQIAHIGIIFLLFLMGLDLKPQELFHLVRKTTMVTAVSSLLFLLLGGGVALLFGYTPLEALIIGGAVTFSSTIIGLKLLPTTVLHHQRTGEVIISILLLQDLIAIVMLLLLQGGAGAGNDFILQELLLVLLALPALIAGGWLVERYILMHLIMRFDQIKEYIFLLAIGWCLGMAELAGYIGLSQEIGAFVAGVALAHSPIGVFIADSLKPLRDFFLVLFFFSLGAGFDLTMLGTVLLPSLLIAALVLAGKPPVFRWLLQRTDESEKRSHEIGFRLGQMSEFSLLIAVLALDLGVISSGASYLIQLSTMLTFLVSAYIIVMRFPTPIAVSDRLRQD
jgi:Kef-type K+ transport system membrane component KefB